MNELLLTLTWRVHLKLMISNLILRLQLWLSGVGYDVEVRYNALNNLQMTSAASPNYHHSGCSVSKLYLEGGCGMCLVRGLFSSFNLHFK